MVKLYSILVDSLCDKDLIWLTSLVREIWFWCLGTRSFN
ncbi:hypothetical protein JCM19233_2178 [Vibrio astriarenae]|nr:hypothetical protein JCM19233_2178 [Vibrio sp. C7]